MPVGSLITVPLLFSPDIAPEASRAYGSLLNVVPLAPPIGFLDPPSVRARKCREPGDNCVASDGPAVAPEATPPFVSMFVCWRKVGLAGAMDRRVPDGPDGGNSDFPEVSPTDSGLTNGFSPENDEFPGEVFGSTAADGTRRAPASSGGSVFLRMSNASTSGEGLSSEPPVSRLVSDPGVVDRLVGALEG